MTRRHTLLVVDDEPDVVASVKDLLRLDYKVLGVTRAADGIQLLEREPVDVIMTDQRMPDVNGVELLEKARALQPDAMRLLFTGYADIRAVVEAINRGNVYRYITKPWDPEELQAVIREACERHDLLAERKQLLAEVQAKNSELEQANVELKRADDLKAAFIRVASHELRTPLTILLGLTDLAARSNHAAEPLAGWLGRMNKAGLRLQHLVDQVVTMLAAQHFERPLDTRPTDLAVLVRRALDDVRPFAEARGHSLSADLVDDLGEIGVDEQKIRDSVNHLLLNAIKFTPDGGQITVGARREDGGARIWVRDTGVGMDEAARRHVFDKFFTDFDVSCHSSGHFEYGKRGLGLGLSVVKAFVEMHRGVVDVESEPGNGTTFTIRLPANG